MVTRTRMPAEERRRVIIDAASTLFARDGFAATTTSQLAIAADVTEPILYRHFSGKAGLYAACVDDAWTVVRDALAGAIDEAADPATWAPSASRIGMAVLRHDHHGQLWIGALTEPRIDPSVREQAHRNLRDLHLTVVDLFERAQAAGGIAADRDPRTEAWIFMSIGIMCAVTAGAGGPTRHDLSDILASRQAWLTDS